jgi:DNA-binding MarR family transcriptional regulator
MSNRSAAVKVQNTRNIDRLAHAVLDVVSLLNSPQRDDVLLAEAGVTLDRALFPLLVRLQRRPLGVADLADQAGRDHTTVSRQLAKLETLGLVARSDGGGDRRRRPAELTDEGRAVVQAITEARRRLLSHALADWTSDDLAALADLNRRFADALIDAAGAR